VLEVFGQLEKRLHQGLAPTLHPDWEAEDISSLMITFQRDDSQFRRLLEIFTPQRSIEKKVQLQIF
jgi:hypothetical protein